MIERSRISAIPGPADAVLPGAPSRVGFLGVLMLDTRFPRPLGDVGHPHTFPWPVRHRIVARAWPDTVVTSAEALRGSALLPAFTEAVRELQSQGARAITTSCGFLVLLQGELQAAVHVPVVSSSLLELPRLLAREPQVGVLTISAGRLDPEHLLASGVPRGRLHDVLVQGVDPSGEFAGAILGNREAMDLARARDDVLSAALQLKSRAPHLRTVVLECTNMPPYAQAVHDASGMEPVSLLNAHRLIQSFHDEPPLP